MGNCMGSGSKSASRDLKDKPAKKNDVVLKNVSQDGQEQRLIVKLLAEVNMLSSDEGPLRWESLFHGLVPASLFCVEQGEVYRYKVCATGVDGTSFFAEIHIPGTNLRKTSACFVQWRDIDKNKGWGMNFMNESDVISFLEGCSPPTLTPNSKKRRHTFSTLSLSLPIPEPLLQDTQETDTQLDAVLLQRRSSDHEVNGADRVMDVFSPISSISMSWTDSNLDTHKMDEYNLSPSSNISLSLIEHANEGSEDHSLFEPSSPLRVTPQAFTLPDIQEEGDEAESLSLISDFSDSHNRSRSLLASPTHLDGDNERIPYHTVLRKQPRKQSYDSARQSFEEAGLDIVETTFDGFELKEDETSSDLLDITSNTNMSLLFDGRSYVSSEEFRIDPPFLPISPPPGPLLSPRYSMLLAEKEQSYLDGALGTDRNHENHNSTLLNQMSTTSIADEEPPPLPQSLPPGKIISPRHSMLQMQNGTIRQNKEDAKQLDLRKLLSKVATVYIEQEAKNRQEEATKQTEDVVQGEISPVTIGNLNTACDRDILDEERVLALAPPIDDVNEYADERPKKTNLKITPSFLSRLEPPKEFTDSGFPDTDENLVISDHSCMHHLPDAAIFSDKVKMFKKDSSTTITSYSEDKQSVHSGSLVSKTNASTSSQLSSTYQNQEDNSSVSTKAGDDDNLETLGEAPMQTIAIPNKDGDEQSTRKTGWLEVKAVLVSKNRKVAMKSKRKWKKYWAVLKGLNLLLYQCDEDYSFREDSHADLKLALELCLVHTIHDHVKRDYVFCITTGNGNTYYMQANLQSEVDDWITNMHCVAAIALTSQNSKEQSIRLLQARLKELYKSIDKEKQLRNMTELNLSTATNVTAKTMASAQVQMCSENIEKYSVELYRIRCYVSSLQGVELPNPQTLLSSVSKQTKIALGKVGIFSVSAFTAMVNTRHGLTLSPSTGSMHSGHRKSSSTKFAGASKKNSKGNKSSTTSLRSREISDPMPIITRRGPITSLSRLTTANVDSWDQAETTDMEEAVPEETSAEGPREMADMSLNFFGVGTPNGQRLQLILRNDMTVQDVLTTISEKQRLNSNDHYVKLKVATDEGIFGYLPNGEDLLTDLIYTSVDVCQKFVHAVILTKEERQSFGLTLSPKWDPNGVDLVTVMVDEVTVNSVAHNKQVHVGDELVLVNDACTSDVGWCEIERLVNTATSLSLTIRTCLIDVPVSNSTAAQIMESLICPAPPPSSQLELSREKLQQLIVPTPGSDCGENGLSTNTQNSRDISNEHLELLMQDAKEVSKQIRVWKIQHERENNAPWTREDRLRKSVSDLIETEYEYVKYLDTLVERYLQPIQTETFISKDEIGVLCGDIVQLVEAQRIFLSSLKESSVDSKVNLSRIAQAFLDNGSHFKGYSTFCASLQKAKDLSSQTDNQQLMAFLEVRNPHQDPSMNMDSLLSKPIVRISRYPLFLNAIVENTDKECDQRESLKATIKMMTKVANSINEMQRLCEAYLLLFESILISSTIPEVRVNINMSELKFHGETMWLDPSIDNLSKGCRKGQGPSLLCFVFSTVIILICLDKRQKRRENKGLREITITKDDLSYSVLLPSVHCRVHNLPDSDGVSNMWQLQYTPTTSTGAGMKGFSFLFRNESPEQKFQLIQCIDLSIKSQQRIYGGTPSSSGRSTPTLRCSSSVSAFVSPFHVSPSFHKSISLSRVTH